MIWTILRICLMLLILSSDPVPCLTLAKLNMLQSPQTKQKQQKPVNYKRHLLNPIESSLSFIYGVFKLFQLVQARKVLSRLTEVLECVLKACMLLPKQTSLGKSFPWSSFWPLHTLSQESKHPWARALRASRLFWVYLMLIPLAH